MCGLVLRRVEHSHITTPKTVYTIYPSTRILFILLALFDLRLGILILAETMCIYDLHVGHLCGIVL